MAVDHDRAFRPFLMLTAALCGGLVMMIEVLGARVIGPFFGVSLFVWTALIAVTLLSLSVGYTVGGHLADRRPGAETLFALIAAAGLWTMLVPVLKPWVVPATLPLGLRAGALVSATVLFAPALVLLGCVSPYVVRIASREWTSLGRTVGLLYALSTLGSMLGTALAGYVVIAYMGVSRAFLLCGGLLIALALAYAAAFRGRRVALVGIPLVAAAWWWPQGPLPVAQTADGTKVKLVAMREGHYGEVKVVDYLGSAARTREMIIDGLVQGGIDLDNGQSLYEYPYLLETLPLAVKPNLRTAVMVGLGAGVVANRLQRHGVGVEVVDINPDVVALAERHFGVRLERPAVVEDARYHLAQPGRRVDLVILDAFAGDSIPGHLLSREALAAVKGRLSDDGVLAINLFASARADSRVAPAVIATLQRVFRQVAAFPLYPLDGRSSGNLVLLAADRPLDAALGARVGDEVHPLAREGLALAMRQGYLVVDRVDELVLSDDFNPLDVLDVNLHELVRRTILESTPSAILLHG